MAWIYFCQCFLTWRGLTYVVRCSNFQRNHLLFPVACSGTLPKFVWGLNCNHKASEHESDLEAICWYLLINSKHSVCSGSEPVRDIYPIIAWSGHSLLGIFFF